jgi:plasmid stabilization system protein ParE
MPEKEFKILIRKEAQVDLDEIFVWYEEQQQGLGLRFINAVDATLQKINTNPYFAFCVEQEARSASLHRFPYDVIYIIDDQKFQVRVIAVIHQRRDPKWFRQRLKLLE